MTNELLSVSMTVNETIQRYPQAVEVFKRFGIDACCGGALPIVDAAARHNVDPVVLVHELQRVVSPQAS